MHEPTRADTGFIPILKKYLFIYLVGFESGNGTAPCPSGLGAWFNLPLALPQPQYYTTRTRGAPDQEMWSANAWAALVATLGLGDVACASTKAAVRAFVFGVAESIGVARAA